RGVCDGICSDEESVVPLKKKLVEYCVLQEALYSIRVCPRKDAATTHGADRFDKQVLEQVAAIRARHLEVEHASPRSSPVSGARQHSGTAGVGHTWARAMPPA